MYTMTRVTRPQMMRRPMAYWPGMEAYFRPFTGVAGPMRTQVKEVDGAYVFDAEMPGFEPGEIELTVLDGALTIAAEHKEGEEGEEGFGARSVRRSFTLEGIDEEGIGAEYKNGVLRVTLPKAKAPDAPQARRIEVR